MSMMVSFVLSFFPRDVLDEILNLIESVSEDFLTTLVSLYAGLPHTPVCDICTLRHRVTLLKSAFPSIHYE